MMKEADTQTQACKMKDASTMTTNYSIVLGTSPSNILPNT